MGRLGTYRFVAGVAVLMSGISAGALCLPHMPLLISITAAVTAFIYACIWWYLGGHQAYVDGLLTALYRRRPVNPYPAGSRPYEHFKRGYSDYWRFY